MPSQEQVNEMFAHMQGAVVVIASYLAGQLIKEGIADRENMVRDIERLAGGDPSGTVAKFRDMVDKMRPWEIIDGGKLD